MTYRQPYPQRDPVAELANANLALRTRWRGDEPGLAPDIVEAMRHDGNKLRLALMVFGYEDPPGAWDYLVRRAEDVDGWPRWDIERVRPGTAVPEGWTGYRKHFEGAPHG